MSRPYFEGGGVTLYLGDCREILPALGPADAIVTDPPYGDTSLSWDRIDGGWLAATRAPQVWCFGSMRFHMEMAPEFRGAGWTYGQEVVWEKHNGSGFTTDRFKRVHEIAMHWYRGTWGDLHRDVPMVPAPAKLYSRKTQPTHTGSIGDQVARTSHERMTRSVLQVRGEHSRAVHPTQKPLGILEPLVRYSVPVGGLVIDPFAGSGSTLLAARLAGRRAIGIEIDERYAQSAAERLSQGDLFATAAPSPQAGGPNA